MYLRLVDTLPQIFHIPLPGSRNSCDARSAELSYGLNVTKLLCWAPWAPNMGATNNNMLPCRE